MFTALSERLTATLKRLTGRGVLSEQDVTEALREIRRHLLEADVSFEVTTGFVERVRERGRGDRREIGEPRSAGREAGARRDRGAAGWDETDARLRTRRADRDPAGWAAGSRSARRVRSRASVTS